MSSSSQGGGSAPPMYFCHMCNIEIRPLMTPQPTCPRCNGGFVEEIDSSRAALDEEDAEDDEYRSEAREEFFGPGSVWSDMNGGQGGGLDVGQLMGNILRGLANAGNEPRRERYETPARPASAPSSGRADAGESSNGSSSGVRAGTSRLGPMNVSWRYESSTNRSGGTSSATTLFGGRANDDEDTHVHDDGMGGAGGAADGRFFNHDNRDRHEVDEDSPSVMADGNGRYGELDVPPELATLRDVFTNLFGGLGDGPGGTLMDLLGGAMRGGRSGDYVWGQQGLDDVISQLMEQTRGSTAPPPASEDAIAGLERFSRKDIKKVRQARNRECSTCMDSFEDEGEEERERDGGLDSNMPTGLRDNEADDPPEVIPEDEQQDALVMMPCHHLFHEDCLVPWLKTSSTCPVCRVSLESKSTQGGGVQGQSHAGPSVSSVSSVPTVSDVPVRATSTHAQIIEEREDTDVEDEDEQEADDSADQRRDRMRRAAEARIQSRGQGNASQSVPGAFTLPSEDLD